MNNRIGAEARSGAPERSSGVASESESQGSGRAIGIGILGSGMMGRAHSAAYRRLGHAFWPMPLAPRLVAVAGRNPQRAAELAARFGYETTYPRWEELIADPRVELFDNAGPNYLHAEPCIAAAKAGKHVVCEKPLARNALEARRMLQAVQAAGVKHMCAFNYRFLPAIRLAKQVIQDGRLGRILQCRLRYLQPSLADPAFPLRWRLDRELAGSGVLGDLGSHVTDLMRFLVGEPIAVIGSLSRFFDQRPLEGDPARVGQVTTDDAFQAIVEFPGGTTGLLEASKVCLGSKNRLELELNGVEGSLRFNLERMNELEVYFREDEKSGLGGFRTVNVTEASHPYAARWWPRHPQGWDQTFVHEVACLLGAIAGEGEVAPHGATFEDGFRAAVICDAIAASAERGAKVAIDYTGEGEAE
jgi:predicted dehydrogenase